MVDYDVYLSAQEVAKILGYSANHIANLAKRGVFPGSWKAGRWFIPKDSVNFKNTKPAVLHQTREEVYDYIKWYMETYTNSPTFRQIARGAGLSSTSIASHHIDALESDGRLQKIKVEEATHLKLTGYELVFMGDNNE